jgi:hypothetical protein
VRVPKTTAVKAFRGFQYLYFLRFSLILWLALPIIAFTDTESRPSALLHAIFTPETSGQFLGAAFFLVCCGWGALLLARVVCLNGGSRFPSVPSVPGWLKRSLGEDSESKVLLVLALAQAPTVYLIFRLHGNSKAEGVPLAVCGDDIRYMAYGVLVAVVFWYLVTVVYYWTFPFERFHRSARTLLYPRWCFGLGRPLSLGAKPVDNIECCSSPYSFISVPIEWCFSRIAALGKGYHDLPGGPLWEAHRLATIGFVGYLAVYICLFPFTAPLPQVIGNRIMLGLGAAALAALALAFAFADIPPIYPKTRRWKWAIVIIFGMLAAVLLGMLLVVSFVPVRLQPWFCPPFLFFPVVGSVAVLTTMVSFFLGGTGFFLDRFSLPVLSALVIVVALFHQIFSRGDDHYFRAQQFNESRPKPTLLSPTEILHERCPDDKKPCSIIVVTATGGGMHAAVWSSTVLVEVEKAFASKSQIQPKFPIFHEQLAYASTVSGGSFGMAAFLREYSTRAGIQPFNSELNAQHQLKYETRIEGTTSCSALEAVAWGLEYSDFIHLLFPFVPPSRWDDRSASLEAGIARNYSLRQCNQDDSMNQAAVYDPMYLSLASLQPTKTLPAFAFNTSEVETGDRFLLANYANPTLTQTGVAPAESFLRLYSADINLLTAARLSATYPVVSSAARIVPEALGGTRDCACLAAHYVDGGYYDNDGIASLIEFLGSALQSDLGHKNDGRPAVRPGGKIRILLVEIRDGTALDTEHSRESGCTKKEEGCSVWGTAQQLDAPLVAFWNTGHGSISNRNHRELTLLNDAFGPYAEITEAVFPFDGPTALSWQLTPVELSDIRQQLGQQDFISALNTTLTWADQEGEQKPRRRHALDAKR